MSNTVTEDQVKAFAAAWYLALDVHAPAEQVATLVAEDDLVMIFPEKTLRSMNDFKAWYAGGTYDDGSKAPGVINIFFDENHNIAELTAKVNGDSAEATIVVAWQASWFVPPSAKSKRVSADFTQAWSLRPTTRNPSGLEIYRYNAMAGPIAWSPGFARL
jgi:hypothetical protein